MGGCLNPRKQKDGFRNRQRPLSLGSGNWSSCPKADRSGRAMASGAIAPLRTFVSLNGYDDPCPSRTDVERAQID